MNAADVANTVRIAAAVEYCGARYCGWQMQKGVDSIQARVESALSRVANHAVRVVAAGRTDTGVHALAQVIHFDTHSRRAMHEWLRGANTFLPDDITVLWVREVDDDFHARFGAQQRSYRYVLLNREVAPAVLHGRVAWHCIALDERAMHQAAMMLQGRHDFGAFRAAACQAKSAQREIRRIAVARNGDWLWLDVVADGFLHHMVRNIVGTLLPIGEGRATVDSMAAVLASRKRERAGITAQPAGLYLTAVHFDARFALPASPAPCKFW